MVVVVVCIVLAAVAVFAIAAVVIGREARRLDAVAPRAVFDLEEAVAYVAERLPGTAQARLSHDDVRKLVQFQVAQLREKGLQPPVAVDQVQDIAEPVLVDPTGAVGFVLARAEAAGLGLADEDVAAVVDSTFSYLRAIGAIGPPADDPDVASPG